MIVYGGNGIGFAIPSSMAIKIVDKLKTVGHVDRGWLGVIIQEVSPDFAQHFGLKDKKGALIGTVQPDTPAAEAGFKEGDIVLNFDGKDIKEFQDLSSFVADTEVGKEVNVVVWRDNKEINLKVKVGLLPDSGQSIPGSGGSAEDIGLQLRDITPDIARSLGIDSSLKGVLVENVAQDSSAAQAGIRPKDIITRFGNKQVSSLADFQNAFNEHKKGAPYVFQIKRGDVNIFVSFTE
jgi:serine protease Do